MLATPDGDNQRVATQQQRQQTPQPHQGEPVRDMDVVMKENREPISNEKMDHTIRNSGAGAASTTDDKTIWNDISVFRDFFLAAFSDGYHNACFCGDVIHPCCDSPSKAGMKPSQGDDTTIRTSRSTNSHDTGGSLQNSLSQETRGSARRRKKPLAVAVGFKYAEDPNGRPIVVTPTGSGSRSSPVDVTMDAGRLSPPRSPPPLPRLRSNNGMPPQGLPPIRPRPSEGTRITPMAVEPTALSASHH